MGLAELIWNNGNILYLTVFSVLSYAFLYSIFLKFSDRVISTLVVFSLSFFTVSYFFGVKIIYIVFAYLNVFIFAFIVFSFWTPKIKEGKRNRGLISVLILGAGVTLYLYK